MTFFTVGPKEARAWTVRRERHARRRRPASSIPISSSGFIRAETIAYDDYVACNGEAGARDAGKLRARRQGLRRQDGDVFHFRFNV